MDIPTTCFRLHCMRVQRSAHNIMRRCLLVVWNFITMESSIHLFRTGMRPLIMTIFVKLYVNFKLERRHNTICSSAREKIRKKRKMTCLMLCRFNIERHRRFNFFGRRRWPFEMCRFAHSNTRGSQGATLTTTTARWWNGRRWGDARIWFNNNSSGSLSHWSGWLFILTARSSVVKGRPADWLWVLAQSVIQRLESPLPIYRNVWL